MSGLREQAEADLAFLVEDPNGFGWPVRVTDPGGAFADMVGLSGNISRLIDPDTGLFVSGNVAHITLRLTTLRTKGLGIPKAIADQSVKPWLITFDDILGKAYTFKVKQSFPDTTIGVVVCILESYSNGTC